MPPPSVDLSMRPRGGENDTITARKKKEKGKEDGKKTMKINDKSKKLAY